MPQLTDLWIFTLASLFLLIIPGPAVFYIVGRTLDEGRRAGIISILGISTGTLVHIGAAAAGVSVVLATSQLAFNLLKIAGALYLVYLGLRSWFSTTTADAEKTDGKSQRSIFYEGIIVNLLNPKAALFFLAFLPQFVQPERGTVFWQIVFLGFFFLFLAILSDMVYVFLAGAVRRRLQQTQGYLHFQKQFSGIIYLTLGVLTLFASYK